MVAAAFKACPLVHSASSVSVIHSESGRAATITRKNKALIAQLESTKQRHIWDARKRRNGFSLLVV